MSNKRERDGKSQLSEAVRKENQEIADFFQKASQPKKKRQQLAVPSSEPTPAVAEMQVSGAGYVSNTFTKTAKKVTRGKNAAKGRGTIQETPVGRRVKQVPSDKPLPKFNYQEDDEDPVLDEDEFLEDDEFPDIHGDGGDDEAPRHIMPSITADATYSVFENDDGIPIGKPIYTDDAWAFSAVKKIQKDIKQKEKPIPAFYLRRDRSPEDVSFQGGDIGPRCKILTFHPDGSFEWPKSSAYLCWNCCCSFEGPPAMIPRYFNACSKFYEVYGNFCNWSCAKRYALQLHNEYASEMSPSLDMFAKKYFGATLPIVTAPPRILLNSFSDFGMTIEEYRQNSQPTRAENYQLIHPPCVPYELFVIWDARNPQKKRLPAYSKVISNRFEGQMSGSVPMPSMPVGISQPQVSMSIHPVAGSVTTTQKKKTKNLLSLLGGTTRPP